MNILEGVGYGDVGFGYGAWVTAASVVVVAFAMVACVALATVAAGPLVS